MVTKYDATKFKDIDIDDIVETQFEDL